MNTIGLLKPKSYGRTITVGGPGSDVSGFDSLAIQRGVECIRSQGGGTVLLGEGTFEMFGPVRVYDNIHLAGSGDSTILKKTRGFQTSFIVDADYGELKVEVDDSSGFCPGMGIQLYDDVNRDTWAVSTATIIEIIGNTVYLDEYLLRDYMAQRNGVISNACSLIEGVNVESVVISNLVIDGNKQNNPDLLNGCRGGGIYFHRAKKCSILNVKVMDFNGDGISWQTTENITVKGCEVTGCTNYGAHPGTGSNYSLIEECSFHGNGSDGLFVCWRVQHGIIKNNKMYNNGGSGINIGHKDICNLFENNHIYKNSYAGIHMRQENYQNAAHYNIYRENMIEDNGNGKGGGIFINAPVREVVIEENIIRDNGEGLQRFGVLIKNPNVERLALKENQYCGHGDTDVVEADEY